MQYRPSFPAYHSRRIDVLGYAPRTSFDGFRWRVARFQNVRVRVTADTIGPRLEWIMLTLAAMESGQEIDWIYVAQSAVCSRP